MKINLSKVYFTSIDNKAFMKLKKEEFHFNFLLDFVTSFIN